MFFPLGLLPPLLRKEVRAQAEVGLQGMDGRKGHSGEMNFYFPYNVKIKYFEPLHVLGEIQAFLHYFIHFFSRDLRETRALAQDATER